MCRVNPRFFAESIVAGADGVRAFDDLAIGRSILRMRGRMRCQIVHGDVNASLDGVIPPTHVGMRAAMARASSSTRIAAGAEGVRAFDDLATGRSILRMRGRMRWQIVHDDVSASLNGVIRPTQVDMRGVMASASSSTRIVASTDHVRAFHDRAIASPDRTNE